MRTPGKPGIGFTGARRSDLLGSTSDIALPESGPDVQRRKLLALAHDALTRLVAADPSVSGATLILPNGEVQFLPAPESTARRQ